MTRRHGEWRIEWHAVLASTMDRARELAEAGDPAGAVVVADYQSAGRGTQGRVWIARPGTCLTFTVLARPRISPAELETLPLRVGTSLAAGLREQIGLDCDIKPPNDLLVRGRKLCGVLCTSRVTGERVEWVLCGIGLNTFMDETERPIESATSLLIEGITPSPHPVLLAMMLSHLSWLIEDGPDGHPVA